jgi:hypothetical protein
MKLQRAFDQQRALMAAYEIRGLDVDWALNWFFHLLLGAVILLGRGMLWMLRRFRNRQQPKANL